MTKSFVDLTLYSNISVVFDAHTNVFLSFISKFLRIEINFVYDFGRENNNIVFPNKLKTDLK